MPYSTGFLLNSKRMKTKSQKRSAVGGPQSAVRRLKISTLFSAILFSCLLNINAAPFYNQNRGLRTADRGQTEQQTDSVFTHIKTISIEAKNIQTDRLGNIYVIS